MNDELRQKLIDDPKLTAYALGELQGDEAREIEAHLKEDKPLRENVEMIRRAAAALSAAFEAELGAESNNEAAAPKRRRMGRLPVGVWYGAAAAVLLAVGIGLLWPATGAARRNARRADPLAAAPQRMPGSSYTPNASGQQRASALPSKNEQDSNYLAAADDISKTRSEGSSSRQLQPGYYPGMAPTQSVGEARSNMAAQRLSSRKRASQPQIPPGTASELEYPGGYPGMAPGMYPGMMPGAQWVLDPNDVLRDTSANAFDHVDDNPFKEVKNSPLSTFSVDVDTASYAIVRRFITQRGTLPPPGAVRIEEMINYFDYDYPQPVGYEPFSVTTDVTQVPWRIDGQRDGQRRLVRIGLKGKEIDREERGAANLVFLIDVSGSMRPEDKLPLLKRSLRMLVDELRPDDRIAIVVYASASGLVLPSTPVEEKQTILEAIANLEAGGSTNGGAGIELAYRIAMERFDAEGINRVILATDGDFNVGMTDQSALTRLIESRRESGVFLSVLGFGLDNLRDATMEKLADKGNGNYAYIDSIMEGHKVLVRQAGGTLVPIAKDVKIQVEFNPARVASYRLIGYENRILAKEDFNDDRKDAGEIGAGHTVTALYEIVPVGQAGDRPDVDGLRYQLREPEAQVDDADDVKEQPFADELLTVKLRYKLPDEDESRLIEKPVKDNVIPLNEVSRDLRFAAAVAAFGMILRDSPHKGDASLERVTELALGSLGDGHVNDGQGDRRRFIEIVEDARGLMERGGRYLRP